MGAVPHAAQRPDNAQRPTGPVRGGSADRKSRGTVFAARRQREESVRPDPAARLQLSGGAMNSIGAFGKLPALAEFISWRLPTEFTVPWHAWLVRGMADARNRIGPAFEDAFAMAPVWRFALPAGAAGSAAVRGILMPSTDAAGRLFPLCLALCVKAGASTPAASW